MKFYTLFFLKIPLVSLRTEGPAPGAGGSAAAQRRRVGRQATVLGPAPGHGPGGPREARRPALRLRFLVWGAASPMAEILPTPSNSF
jgi:hypothetical protein